ncbi:replication-relaxation family protein [Actinophytocola algeriensis]|uniref:Protein involved in plasmid replication-relaxation n=1 Tax=Actinophytocola algeriensis TaxID=1768010 RepID=A0A7W7VHK9_9PSEU|nr:replication-relaxation family protein [Actinophytocola algeriensis]MBB4910531.1 hypothetical protein [Actinophytocola algeriensis]MBE1480480.1 hypothetical protein [Actinophytocola algeriensis]
MTAPIGAAARIARLRRSMSELDLTALNSLDRLRLLTTNHVQRLHLATGSPATRSRRTRALLRRLTDRGLVVRLPRDIGGHRAGSATSTFCLTRLGQAVLTAPEVPPRRRMLWQTKPYFQDHMLAVAELYVGLVEACRDKNAELLAFEAEPTCWRRFSGPGGETLILKPDAVVRVGTGDFELASFIEVDLGTESLPTIHRKCQVYLRYWRSGQEQRDHGVFPRVWWLVHDLARLKAIVRVVGRLPSDAQPLFAIALTEEAADQLVQLPAPGDTA